MPSLRRTSTAAALTIAALATASCGGEDKLSKQEYIAAAEKVCKDVEGKIDAIEQPQSADGLKDYVGKIKPLLDDAITRFEDLEPADEVKGDAEALLGSTRDARKLADALTDTSDQAEVQRLSQAAGQKEQAIDARLKRAGFDECADD